MTRGPITLFRGGTGEVAFEGEASPAPGGGSMPGASRWIGPCKINTFQGQYFASPQTFTGGSFTLTINGETTADIDFNATAAEIQAALEALPSIGAGNVSVVFTATNLTDGDATITFKELVATELALGDGTKLTGPDAPYDLSTAVSGATAWLVELLTPAVGDIVEDFLHSIPVAFDAGAGLMYSDNTSQPDDAVPTWSNPGSWAGVGQGLTLDNANEYTNFSGNGSSAAESKPTSLQAMQVAPVDAAATLSYSNLPAVVVNSVPIYTYLENVDAAPTQGEVWIYVKTATPDPDMS